MGLFAAKELSDINEKHDVIDRVSDVASKAYALHKEDKLDLDKVATLAVDEFNKEHKPQPETKADPKQKSKLGQVGRLFADQVKKTMSPGKNEAGFLKNVFGSDSENNDDFDFKNMFKEYGPLGAIVGMGLASYKFIGWKGALALTASLVIAHKTGLMEMAKDAIFDDNKPEPGNI